MRMAANFCVHSTLLLGTKTQSFDPAWEKFQAAVVLLNGFDIHQKWIVRYFRSWIVVEAEKYFLEPEIQNGVEFCEEEKPAEQQWSPMCFTWLYSAPLALVALKSGGIEVWWKNGGI